MKKLFVVTIFLFSGFSISAQERVFSLEEAIDYALENNLMVRQGLLDVKLNDINYDQSRRDQLPDLNANSSYNYSWGRSIDPTTNLFVENRRIASANAGISSNVLLFNGFRQKNAIRQNQYALEASQENMKATKNDVILNVITFYMNVLFAQSLSQIAENQVNATMNQLEATRKRVEAGAVPQSNLLDLLSQQAQNEVNLINRNNDLIMAKIQLKQALQLPPATEIEIVDPEVEIDSEEIIQETALEVYEFAVQNMPEIRSAQYNLESAEYGVQSTRGGLYPSLFLNAGLSTNYSDVAEDLPRFVRDGGDPVVINNPEIGFVEINGSQQPVFSNEQQIIPSGEIIDGYPFIDQVDDNLRKYISLSLNVPIFNGLQARANIQRAQISKERAEINLKNEKYLLWQTVEQSYADVVAALKSYAASEAQVKATEEAFRMTEKRYDLGAATFIDYQIAENQMFQAQADLLQAKYDFIYKSKILDFYLGNPIGF